MGSPEAPTARLRRLRSRHGDAALLGILLLIVLFFPHASLVGTFVTTTTMIGSLGAVLWGLTFWRPARVQIGRLKFRFRVVRRAAGATALVALCFLVMQRGALRVWGNQEQVTANVPPGSTTASAAARLASGSEQQTATPSQFITGDNGTFSPDGQRVFWTSSSATMIWDADKGNLLAVLRGHSAALSPDGRRVVTASADNSAQVWDAESGRLLAVLRGHQDAVNSAKFSPDGGRVVTASADKTARVWDARSGKTLAVLQDRQGSMNSAQFSPDGRRIVTVSTTTTSPDASSTIRIWDAHSGEILAELLRSSPGIASAEFSTDGRRIVSVSTIESSRETIRVWDAGSLKIMADQQMVGMWDPALSTDGRRLLTQTDPSTARLWDTHSGKVLAVLHGYQRTRNLADFSSDGRWIVTASSDNTARVWDAQSGELHAVLKGHRDEVESAAFSPDGRRVVTASADKTARVWDAESGELLAVLQGHQDKVSDAAFSPDGERVVTVSLDGTMRTWDAGSGKAEAVMRQLEDEQKFGEYVVRVYLDGDGNSFEILRNGRLVFEQKAGGHFDVGLPEDEVDDPDELKRVAMGNDIIGDGEPDLVVSEYSGGAHCCFIVHIFEIGHEFRKIATIDGRDSVPRFEHLDKGPGLQIVMSDWTFAYWHTDFVHSTAPRIVLRYRDGSYQVATDLMGGPAPSLRELGKLAAKVNADWPKSGGKYSDYDEDISLPELLNAILPLAYTGHADLAWRLVDMAWPSQVRGKDEFLRDFGELLSESQYWPDVRKKFLLDYASLLAKIAREPNLDPTLLPDDAEKRAFVVAEQAHGTLAQAALAMAALRAAAGDPATSDLARQVQDLGNQRANLKRKIDASYGDPAASEFVRKVMETYAILQNNLKGKIDAPSDENNDQFDDPEKQLQHLNSHLAAASEQLYKACPKCRESSAPEPITPAEIQKRLRLGEAVVSYLALDDRILAWLVRPDAAISYRDMPIDRADLHAMVARLRASLKLRGSDNSERPYDVADAYALEKLLLEPFVKELAGIKHLIVVPDDPLLPVPFAALVVSDQGAAYAALADTYRKGLAPSPAELRDDYPRISWILRSDFTISELPTATSLRALRGWPDARELPTAPAEPFIGVGDPVLAGAGGERGGAMLATRGAASIDDIRKLPRLPGTRDELIADAKALGADPSSALFMGEQATKPEVMKLNNERLAGTRVIAFATHALIGGEIKGLAEPALVLTPPSQPTENDDGLLGLDDVMELKLKETEWVVLSACNTAAPGGSGEGFSGLTRAFFYAGTPSLLVSQWSVDDAATDQLMTDLFTSYGKGTNVSRASALHDAMLKLMTVGETDPAHARFAHPFAWAPFIVVGEGGVAANGVEESNARDHKVAANEVVAKEVTANAVVANLVPNSTTGVNLVPHVTRSISFSSDPKPTVEKLTDQAFSLLSDVEVAQEKLNVSPLRNAVAIFASESLTLEQAIQANDGNGEAKAIEALHSDRHAVESEMASGHATVGEEEWSEIALTLDQLQGQIVKP